MRSSKAGSKTSSVVLAVWHVVPSCWNQMLPISFSSIFVNKHGPIAIAIDCNGLSELIFEEKWPNYASGSKSIPNSDSFWVFCAPNATILLVYIPAKIKISFSWKDDFFFAKIGIFCKSIAGPLPSVVQAHTQPYSFGGSIKLIICQIRHELSVTIQEISTSWKTKR